MTADSVVIVFFFRCKREGNNGLVKDIPRLGMVFPLQGGQGLLVETPEEIVKHFIPGLVPDFAHFFLSHFFTLPSPQIALRAGLAGVSEQVANIDTYGISDSGQILNTHNFSTVQHIAELLFSESGSFGNCLL